MPDRPKIAVFDVGGVLLDWNLRHLYRKIFSEPDEMEAFFREVMTRPWWLQTDAGTPVADAVRQLSAEFPDHAELIAAVDLRWRETVSDVIHGTVAILQELRKLGQATYAITNFPGDKFLEARCIWPFLDRFDGAIVSGDEGLLKPDPAIYHLLLDRYDLRAEDCIFIDDSAGNAQAARDIGMFGHHFTSPECLRAVLGEYGFFD